MGLRRAADFGTEQLSRDHVQLRTSKPAGLHNRISMILESDPALIESPAPLGGGSTHHFFDHLFDATCMTSSPIETVWNYNPGME